MGNPVLEENQAKSFSDVIAKYFFTAQGGGAKTAKSPPKKALKLGIRLHFLRYGLFYKESSKDIGYNIDGPKGDHYTISEINASQSEIPNLDNFYIAKTALNQGYIYLINDADKENDYYEYEVDENGKLSTITWGYNKKNGKYLDIRKSENDSLDYKVISQGKKFWIAYSPIQWSRDYVIDKMIRDEELRKKRMVLIDCGGIKKGSEDQDSNIVPHTKLRTSHYKNHPHHNTQKSLCKDIEADEKKQDEKGDNDLFEDMFIALDDPIGCANDIGNQLVSKYNRHDAIIESIQTGKNENYIFNRLEKGEKRSNSSSEYEQQVNGLFSSALTTYQMIYNNSEMEDEYSDTTDKSKLLKILAVNERKEVRKKITELRDDYGNFLSSDYYKKYFFDFLQGGTQELFEGKSILPLHLSLLAMHPHDKDRHLDLIKDYTGKNDKWSSFFNETLQESHDFNKILSKELKIEELKQSIFSAEIGFKLSRQLIRNMKSSLDAYAKYVVRDEKFTVLLDYMKSFSYRNQTIIQIKPSQALGTVKGFTLDLRKMIDQEQLVSNKRGDIGKERIRIKTNLSVEEAKRFAANKEIELSYKADGNKASTIIKEIFESPRFRAFLSGLELVNAVVSFNKASKDSTTKNIISSGGAIFNLASASSAYAEAKMLQKGLESTDDILKFTKGFSKITGFVGSGVSVTMCVWDSVESYQSRDYDASLVWGLTAIVSGILLADGIFVLATGATVGFLGFWLVVILSALFFGGIFLAIYLTDTPLEKYLKNSALSDDESISLDNAKPFEYIKKIYDERHRLVSDKFKEWRDFRKSANQLYDLLISYRVKDKALKFYHEPQKNKGFIDHLKDAIQIQSGTKYKKIQELKINVNLRKFLYNESKFDFAIKLFFNGIKSSSSKDVKLISKSANISTNNNGADILEIIYRIPQSIINKISLSSEFIFISRTIINEKLNEYWPHQNRGERYLAYKFSATDWAAPTGSMIISERINSVLDDLWGTNIRIGTESEVFNNINWSK